VPLLIVYLAIKLRRLLAVALRLDHGRIVRCPPQDAAYFLDQADGDVKTAVLIGFGLGLGEAAALLQRHAGNLRSAIGETRGAHG